MSKLPAPAAEPTLRRTPRVAANPIPYWARDGKVDKSKEVFDQAFADFADIGFTAVKADVPEGRWPVSGPKPITSGPRWAGIDPAAMITRYADRIGGIHIKDCFTDYLTPESRQGLNYRELGATKRLWAEPGRGVVDFDAVVAAMPADYDGDYLIEIDEPSVESRYESHNMSFDWARQALSFISA